MNPYPYYIPANGDGSDPTICNPYTVVANTCTTGTYTARGNQVYQGDRLLCVATDHSTAQRIARALGQEARS